MVVVCPSAGGNDTTTAHSSALRTQAICFWLTKYRNEDQPPILVLTGAMGPVVQHLSNFAGSRPNNKEPTQNKIEQQQEVEHKLNRCQTGSWLQVYGVVPCPALRVLDTSAPEPKRKTSFVVSREPKTRVYQRKASYRGTLPG
jgi:hypothetical protein